MSRSRLLFFAAGGGAVVTLALAMAKAATSDEERPAFWRLLERIADAKGFRKEFDAVPAHLALVVKQHEPLLGKSRLAMVAHALSEPWSVPALARELRDGLAAAVAPPSANASLQPDLAALAERVAAWLDVDLAEPADADSPLPDFAALWAEIGKPQLVELELLQRLSDYVGACHRALVPAFANLDDEQRAFLRDHFADVCELWYRSHFPKGERTLEQFQLFEKYKALPRKVDRARLLRVAHAVARLADPEFLNALGKRLAKTPRTQDKVEGFSSDVIATVGGSPENRVVLLGAGKTVVSGKAALIIDLGGDDTYERAAVVDSADALVSVVLDLNGNDVYTNERTAAGEQPGPAYAAGGVALLVDAKGKDRYESKRLGQGASSLGFAALVDLQGDDRYVAEDYVQGFTFCGVGLLLDREGNDSYDAFAYAQGAGIGNGFSALVDGGGNDRYFANKHWPDVYGDSGPDSYHGASQGYCTGLRQSQDQLPEIELAGGIAALIDVGDGKDYYESGNFSQGGGYYFSFGLMYDGGGDDENHGYRYSQGFGVHQAVGVRWDAGGNDVYSTKCAANCGASWDEGVGYFLEDGGNDQYDVGGIALGGAAQTAITVMIEGGGDDRYGGGGGNDAQGGTDGHDYHEKEGIPQSIGALIDLGGGKDVYSRKDRGDDCALTGDLYGIFVDTKEKNVEALLDAATLKKLLDAKPTLPPPPKPAKPEKPAKPKH